eukprot:SAG31_NODE_4947_length_2843_cov_1.582362_2_plen_338_part_00
MIAPYVVVLCVPPSSIRWLRLCVPPLSGSGYVAGLPVFGDGGVAGLQEGFGRLTALFEQETGRSGSEISRVNMWHKANRWVYELSRTTEILDCVEDLLGPNIAQWGAHFFVKYPGDGTVVPYHQDAQYWPLTPHRTVSVWLAFYDVSAKSGAYSTASALPSLLLRTHPPVCIGAMHIVRGSHKRGKGKGVYRHHEVQGPQYMLAQEVDEAEIDDSQLIPLELRAGHISLHDDGLIHGSPANVSDVPRCGLVMRFVPTEVVCDLTVRHTTFSRVLDVIIVAIYFSCCASKRVVQQIWPTFEALVARGFDHHGHNPAGKIPASNDAVPTKLFPHSSEFP